MNSTLNTTSWKFYTSTPEIWEAMIGACEAATETIDFEQFNFTPDTIGNRFIDVCARKAAQGVKVRFIWDAAGSFSFFRTSIIEDLSKKGITLLFFKTLLPDFFNIHNYRSWYFRNHRRTLVIDGKVGFTGSICISEKMKIWRETQVKVEGPIVIDMTRAFEKIWRRAQPMAKRRRPPSNQESRRSDPEFEYVANTPLPGNRRLYARTVEAIRTSQKSVCITTPYFVPTHRLLRVLRLAAHRGVEVKVIIPQSSDFPLVDFGARTFFHTLLKSGVRIFLYQGRMIHTKTVVIDEDWSSIGTLNLDHISLLYNFEANLISTNIHFANDLIAHFNADLVHSQEMTLEIWARRSFIDRIATFFVTFIRTFL